MPRYVLFAGVNGAGKSTMYHTDQSLHNMERVNVDEILRSFGGDWRKEEDQKKAAMLAVQKEKELLDAKISYNKETVLHGKSAKYTIKMVKELGYTVDVRYVGVESPEISIERIKKRVLDGGHGIPDDVVRDRYQKSLDNLAKIIPLSDSVIVYDNTVSYRTVASFVNGELTAITDDCPGWFAGVLSKLDINP